MVPDLEHQLALVAIQVALEFLDVVGVVAAQRQQRLGRLRKLGIEQFVDFVMGVDVGPRQGRKPAEGDAAEHGDEQAATQRKPGRHLGIV